MKAFILILYEVYVTFNLYAFSKHILFNNNLFCLFLPESSSCCSEYIGKLSELILGSVSSS